MCSDYGDTYPLYLFPHSATGNPIGCDSLYSAILIIDAAIVGVSLCVPGVYYWLRVSWSIRLSSLVWRWR